MQDSEQVGSAARVNVITANIVIPTDNVIPAWLLSSPRGYCHPREGGDPWCAYMDPRLRGDDSNRGDDQFTRDDHLTRGRQYQR